MLFSLSFPTRKLSGFISRWMNPCEWTLLNPFQNLQANHHNSLMREGLVLLFENIFKWVAQHLHDHDTLLALVKILVDLNLKWEYFENASFVCFSVIIQNLQNLWLVIQLRILWSVLLDLDCEFLVSFVECAENLSESPWAELRPYNFIFSVIFHW